jgi:four helix bundle protein
MTASYRDLVVWQKAMDWLDAVYDASELWPQRELFRSTDQLRRSALSVPANIAEGKGRLGSKEFLHHLSIANGSLCEAETCLIAAGRRSYIEESDLALLLVMGEEVGRMMQGLMTSLQSRIDQQASPRRTRSEPATRNP